MHSSRDTLAGKLGALAVRHRWWVLALWLLLALVAGLVSPRLSTVLRGELGSVPGAESGRVAEALSRDFDFPYAQMALVAVKANAGTGEARLDERTRDLMAVLGQAPDVRGVRELPGRSPGWRAVAVGLAADGMKEAEHAVPRLRALLARVMPPGAETRAMLTGHAALNTDMVQLSSRQTKESEQRIMPLMLVVLLVAFGALGAAVTPLVTGSVAVLLAMGLLLGVGQLMPLSVYAANVATMVGLGLGIDYALLVVSRIREETLAGRPHLEAVRTAAVRTAPVIVGSVITVMIGLGGLLRVPVSETVAMGTGGMIVAGTSMLAALTLLPALAAVLGRWLEAPQAFSRRMTGEARFRRWQAVATWVTARPMRAFMAATLLLVVLMLPVRGIRFGFPDLSLAPKSLESVQAFDGILEMGLGGAFVPIQVLVTAPPGEGVLTPARLSGLARLYEDLSADPRVAQAFAIARPGDDLPRLQAGSALFGPRGLRDRLPPEARTLVSRDGSATLIQLYPDSRVAYPDVRALTARLRTVEPTRYPGLGGSELLVGGSSAVDLDFAAFSRAQLPQLALWVAVATCLALFVFMRSLVIPLKAVVTNFMTVAAALGAAWWLCSTPMTAHWVGLSAPITSMPASTPLVIFALLFGLSMDYEVMLIGRIREARDQGLADRAAVIEGMGRSGSVITYAALLMAIVFIGFASTELVPVKIMGIALAIGVLLDATVTRLLLVPSLIVLLGRWNWWPGDRARP